MNKKQFLFLYIALLILILVGLSGFSQDERVQNPKVYVATMVLNAGSAPTVVELVNTTGSVIAVSRVTAGQYRIESSPPLFTIGRTIYQTHHYVMGPSATIQVSLKCPATAYCALSAYHADPLGNSLFFYDGGSAQQAIPIRIEVYP